MHPFHDEVQHAPGEASAIPGTSHDADQWLFAAICISPWECAIVGDVSKHNVMVRIYQSNTGTGIDLRPCFIDFGGAVTILDFKRIQRYLANGGFDVGRCGIGLSGAIGQPSTGCGGQNQGADLLQMHSILSELLEELSTSPVLCKKILALRLGTWLLTFTHLPKMSESKSMDPFIDVRVLVYFAL